MPNYTVWILITMASRELQENGVAGFIWPIGALSGGGEE